MNYRWYANLPPRTLPISSPPLLSITLHYEIACHKVVRCCTAITANSLSERCLARSRLFRWSFWRVSVLSKSQPRERWYAVIKGRSTPGSSISSALSSYFPRRPSLPIYSNSILVLIISLFLLSKGYSQSVAINPRKCTTLVLSPRFISHRDSPPSFPSI